MSLKYFAFLTLSAIIIVSSCSGSTDAVDEPPEIEIPSILSAIIGVEFSHVIEVSDPQGLDVELTVTDMPDWMTFMPSENLLHGTPGDDDIGLYRFSLEADNGSLITSRDVYVRIFRSEAEAGLQSRVETARNSTTPGLNGISVTVIDRHEQIFQAYMGTSGSGLGSSAINEKNLFRVASVTKPMTAALILKLADDGEIDLDATVAEYYETELPNADTITIRHLLSHTGGVFDHLNSSSFWGDPSFTPTKVWTVEELVDFAVRNGPVFTPGSAYGYSNTGFCILGAIIEEVTELEIQDAFREMLFEPMGLSSAVYDNFSTNNDPIENLAQNSRTYEYHLTAAGAAGAVAATPEDVARFGRALYGGRYLSAALTDKMSENIGETVGGQNYGFGTRIWNIGGIPHHGHTGALLDYRNILMYVPDADLTIAIHTHDVHSNWFVLVDEIFDYAVQNYSDGLAKPVPFVYGAETREEDLPDAVIKFIP